MSFRDELNSIRPDMKMISEQEMYETILHEIYEEIKNNIREDAKTKVYNNKLTGVVYWERWIGYRKYVDKKEYNRIQEKESLLYENGEGRYFCLKRRITECTVKKCLFSNFGNVTVSLNSIGKKYVDDLIELGREDGISFSFKPIVCNTRFSKFNVPDKVNLDDIHYRKGETYVRLNIYYEVEL